MRASAIMKVDGGAHSVVLDLVAGYTGTYGGFNFDGYSEGAMTVRIPLGWHVEVLCHNASTVLTHTCAVIHDVAIAPSGGPIVFGASTPSPISGLPCGSTKSYGFVASRVGRYRIACLVVGHEADGMWDWLEVTSGGAPVVET